MRKKAALIATAIALVTAPAAGAHVTLSPDEASADSFARFAIRVPNERPNAQTTRISVRLPKGLFFVSFQPKSGWQRTVTTERLRPPQKVFGETIRERVATVTWSGGRIGPGEFDEFGISAKLPNSPGAGFSFPALQFYSSGEVVRWIQPPDGEQPAPRVTLVAAGRADTSARANQPTSKEDGANEEYDDGDRADLALGVAGAGLLAGLAALGLSLTRRRR